MTLSQLYNILYTHRDAPQYHRIALKTGIYTLAQLRLIAARNADQPDDTRVIPDQHDGVLHINHHGNTIYLHLNTGLRSATVELDPADAYDYAVTLMWAAHHAEHNAPH